jgi:hypothetical protein
VVKKQDENGRRGEDSRVFVHESGGVVDFVVDDEVEVVF